MNKKDEALKLALEALSPWANEDANHTEQYAAYHAIREALADMGNPITEQQAITGLDVYLDPEDELKPKLYSTQQQEPVAFVNADHLQGLTLGNYGYVEIYTDESEGRIPLYTSPPQRKPWVGLTDEEIEDIWNSYCDEMGEASINDAPDIARAIESALRSKNT